MASTSIGKMDDRNVMSNRDEAIPVLRIPSSRGHDNDNDEYDDNDDDISHSVSDSEVKIRRREKFLNNVGNVGNKFKDKMEEYGTTEARQTLQDRMFASILSQIVPPEEAGEGEHDTYKSPKKDRRSKKYVDRPEFGPRLMAYNFRRFNSRIGIVFVLQNRLIRLFTWKSPTATLSFLAIHSLLCLKPHLLPLIPLVGLLFSIMIPSFLARHPAPANDPRLEPSFRGPPTAPPSRVKPAADLSQDFWRNMRDLQNCMEDFSRIHDAGNEYITPYTNFSDEPLSSSLYLVLFAISCVAFLGSQLVPWRAIMLLGGWMLTVAGHPRAQKLILSARSLSQLRQTLEALQMTFRHWIETDVVLDEPSEQRQVEVFELQRFHSASAIWEPWLFSPAPYDPLGSARMGEDRPKGTQFFEDVQPPRGWVWKQKKWSLDLLSREWVEERMITGVEIETEGERWVYDLKADELEELLDNPLRVGKNPKRVLSIPMSGWEEGTGLDERGEWRRRRWTRLVEREPDRSGDKQKV